MRIECMWALRSPSGSIVFDTVRQERYQSLDAALCWLSNFEAFMPREEIYATTENSWRRALRRGWKLVRVVPVEVKR